MSATLTQDSLNARDDTSGSHEEDSTSFITIGIPARLSSTMITDDKSSAGLALGDFATEAKIMIAEAERRVLEERGTFLRPGWVPSLLIMIDRAEARIRSEQASWIAVEEHPQARNGWDSAEVWWRPKQDVSVSTTEASCSRIDGSGRASGTGLADDKRKFSDSDILAELSDKNTRMERKYAVVDLHSELDELQQDVQAILSVITMQMADFRSLKQQQTSDLAWFSILEEEFDILKDLINQIQDLYEPLDDMGEGLTYEVLQYRFDALPVQLHAIFNMSCQERERNSGEIDDEEMMHIVLENQKRTDMLRNVRDLLERKQNILHEMENMGRKQKTSPTYGV